MLRGRVVAEQKPYFHHQSDLRFLSRYSHAAVFLPLTSALLRAIATLPFVISTGAQRSGEISVRMLFLGNAFRLIDVEERKCGHLAFEMWDKRISPLLAN